MRYYNARIIVFLLLSIFVPAYGATAEVQQNQAMALEAVADLKKNYEFYVNLEIDVKMRDYFFARDIIAKLILKPAERFMEAAENLFGQLGQLGAKQTEIADALQEIFSTLFKFFDSITDTKFKDSFIEVFQSRAISEKEDRSPHDFALDLRTALKNLSGKLSEENYNKFASVYSRYVYRVVLSAYISDLPYLTSGFGYAERLGNMVDTIQDYAAINDFISPITGKKVKLNEILMDLFFNLVTATATGIRPATIAAAIKAGTVNIEKIGPLLGKGRFPGEERFPLAIEKREKLGPRKPKEEAVNFAFYTILEKPEQEKYLHTVAQILLNLNPLEYSVDERSNYLTSQLPQLASYAAELKQIQGVQDWMSIMDVDFVPLREFAENKLPALQEEKARPEPTPPPAPAPAPTPAPEPEPEPMPELTLQELQNLLLQLELELSALDAHVE